MAGVDDYSTTPNSNTTINGIDIDENCAPSGMNNAVRQLLADIRKVLNDIGAKAVSSGTDTITLTTETGYAAYADGTLLSFIAGGTCTGAATLNVDSVGAKAVLKGAGTALAAGDITAGQVVVVVYDESADGASGAWMMANSSSLAAILSAIAALSSTGLIARTGSGTVSARTITGTSNKITVTNGDGVSGNPTLTIGSDIKQVGTETIWIPAAAMVARATSGAGSSTYDSGASDVTIKTMDFDTTTQEYAHTIPVGMPKSWDESTVAAVFYWTNTGGSSTQTVRWSIAGRAVGDDDAINGSFGTAQTVDDTWLAQNDMHISSATSAITIGNTPAENDMVIFEITRVVASDNMSGDAKLIGVKILITTNAANDA